MTETGSAKAITVIMMHACLRCVVLQTRLSNRGDSLEVHHEVRKTLS